MLWIVLKDVLHVPGPPKTYMREHPTLGALSRNDPVFSHLETMGDRSQSSDSHLIRDYSQTDTRQSFDE